MPTPANNSGKPQVPGAETIRADLETTVHSTHPRAFFNSIPLGIWLVIPTLALFLVGIFAPSVIVKEFGNTRYLSLLNGIQVLWATDHAFLAIIIFLFTILFPPAKLALTVAVSIPVIPIAQRSRRRLRRLVEVLGRWSLLDVMVIAILIVAIKVQGFVSVQASWGIYAFSLSILLSMLATHVLQVPKAVPPMVSARESWPACEPRILWIVGIALATCGAAWFILNLGRNLEHVLVTKKETFIELPRFFGNPSFYLRIHTVHGVQRLATKPRTPIGNGLLWTLEQPVSLADVYELEVLEDGFLADKIVDRVTVNGRRAIGERFQFELKCSARWQLPVSLSAVTVGLALLIFGCCRMKRISKSTCNVTNP